MNMDERDRLIEPEDYRRSRPGHQNHNQGQPSLSDIEPLAMNGVDGRQRRQQRQQQQQHVDDSDGLFHLQQALLRRELPDPQRYDDIRREQSQRLEQFLRREQVAWQQKQQLAALRDSLAAGGGSNNNEGLSASDHGGTARDASFGLRETRRMGSSSFSLDSTYPTGGNDNAGSTAGFRSSEPGNGTGDGTEPLCLPTRRELRERRLMQELRERRLMQEQQRQQQQQSAMNGAMLQSAAPRMNSEHVLAIQRLLGVPQMNSKHILAIKQQQQQQQQHHQQQQLKQREIEQTMNERPRLNSSSLDGAVLQSHLQSPVPRTNEPILALQQQQQQPRLSSRPYSSFTLGSAVDFGTAGGYIEPGFGASDLEAARRSFCDGQETNDNFDAKLEGDGRSFREPRQQQQYQTSNASFQPQSGQQYGLALGNDSFAQSGANDVKAAGGSINFVAARFVPPSALRQQEQYEIAEDDDSPSSTCSQRVQSYRNSDGGAPIDFDSSARDFNTPMKDFESSMRDFNASMNFNSSVASSIVEPDEKRQRFNGNNSDTLLLEMLNDTIVSPASTKATIGSQSLVAGGSNCEANGMASGKQSFVKHGPIFSGHNQNESRASTLTPLSQPDGGVMEAGCALDMFADFLLRATTDNGASGIDASAMPPLPLTNKSNRNKKDPSKAHRGNEQFKSPSREQGLMEKQYGGASLLDSSLPLPSRNKGQHKNSPQTKKKTHKVQKKGRQDGAACDHHSAPNPNHVTTPSTSTISALSREIRTKMQGASSASLDDGVPADEARPSDADGDGGEGGFSIPHFASAMEATQASQQAIHDWDRKFGLRRAHSKTMRESCRSRKRVLEFLKGEGAKILLLAKTNKDASASNSRTSSGSGAAVDTASSRVTHADENMESAADDVVHSRDKVKPSDDLDVVFRGGKAQPMEDLVLPSSESRLVSLPKNTEEISEATREGQSARTDNTGLQSNQNDEQDRRDSDFGIDGKLDGPVQLERMFRRASLDCVKGLLPKDVKAILSGGGDSPSSLTSIDLTEADRKQYLARGA